MKASSRIMFSSKKKNSSNVGSPSLLKRSSKSLSNFLSSNKKPERAACSNSTTPVSFRRQNISNSSSPSFGRQQNNLSIETLHSTYRQGNSISPTPSSSHSSLYTPTGSYRFSPNTSADSAVQLWVRKNKLVMLVSLFHYINIEVICI